MTTDKRCTRCEIAKPIAEFSKAKGYRGGYNAQCKVCLVAVRAEAYRRNPGKFNARTVSWQRRNWPRVLAIAERSRRAKGIKPKLVYPTDEARGAAQAANKRRYVERHPERTRAAKIAYAKRHPERVKDTMDRNRARRRAAPGEVTAQQWREIVLFYGNACARCHVSASERPLTVDHYIPISKGGAHDWTNVWPLCLPCNRKKRDSIPDASAPPHVAVLVKTGT